MELDKTMEIGFSDLFPTVFPKYFHTMEEIQISLVAVLELSEELIRMTTE